MPSIPRTTAQSHAFYPLPCRCQHCQCHGDDERHDPALCHLAICSMPGFGEVIPSERGYGFIVWMCIVCMDSLCKRGCERRWVWNHCGARHGGSCACLHVCCLHSRSKDTKKCPYFYLLSSICPPPMQTIASALPTEVRSSVLASCNVRGSTVGTAGRRLLQDPACPQDSSVVYTAMTLTVRNMPHDVLDSLALTHTGMIHSHVRKLAGMYVMYRKLPNTCPHSLAHSLTLMCRTLPPPTSRRRWPVSTHCLPPAPTL